MVRTVVLLAVGVIALAQSHTDNSAEAWSRAIRSNNVQQVQPLLQAGANPNTEDNFGNTPLMLAAAYASHDMLEALIKAGAGVNRTNRSGATALMWGAHDRENVRALLEVGAAINTKNKNGTTALLVAARQGSLDALRLLIERGADPKANDGADLLAIALYRQDDEMVRLAEALGLTLDNTPGPNALFAHFRNPGIVRRLLQRGADPDETVPMTTTSFPLLGWAAFEQEESTVRALVDNGANLNATGRTGITPLMMAAAARHSSPRVVQYLIDSGADVNGRDSQGRTALDWSLTQGDTAAAEVLRAAGGRGSVRADTRPAPTTPRRSIREAVARAIARLQPIGPSFYAHTKCISCHNESLPAIAVKLASAKGLAIDRVAAAHPTTATTVVWRGFRDEFLLGRCALPGFLPNVTYGLLSFDIEGVPPNDVSDAAVLCLAADQRSDGSWRIEDPRPPLIDSSTIVPTALAIRALSRYAPEGRRGDLREHVGRAVQYVRSAPVGDTQEQVFKLLGLSWGHVTHAEVTAQLERLLALQRADGGWSQLPTMESDAYATGQALYALHEAGVASSSTTYRRGVIYLRRTQGEDGTWFVRSRAFAFQPFFDAGFPHGRDQFISAAATAWAAIALTYSL